MIRRSPPAQRERDEVHRPLVARLRLAKPTLLFAHVPNESTAPVQRRAMLASMGLLTGCPDLLIFTPPPSLPRCCGCALELKAIGGKPTDAQLEVLKQLAALGWAAAIGYGLQHSVDTLRAMGYEIPIVGGV